MLGGGHGTATVAAGGALCHPAGRGAMPEPSLLALVKGNSSMVTWFCHQLGEWLRGHQSHGSRGLSGLALEKTLIPQQHR